ncbi:MAG: SCO family protein [Chloroflexi bacterium]|nr:SCO family protein [Chloroflexota bacterium]
MSLGNLRGRVVVLTFLYTHCPDTCPLYVSKIKQALTGLAAPGDISVIAVTVDPERDTVEQLGTFAGNWPAGWHFLTGNPAEAARVWSSYGVYVEKEEATLHSTAHEYGVTHSAKVVLIDRRGYTASELKGDWTAAELRKGVELLAGPGQRGGSWGLSSPVVTFLQRCGEFASSHPWVYMGLVFLITAPALGLSAYLLRVFFHTKSP